MTFDPVRVTPIRATDLVLIGTYRRTRTDDKRKKDQTGSIVVHRASVRHLADLLHDIADRLDAEDRA